MQAEIFEHDDPGHRVLNRYTSELQQDCANFEAGMHAALKKLDGREASLYAEWIFCHERELEYRRLNPTDVSAE